MKKYSLWDNMKFLLGCIRRYIPQSFRMMFVGAALKVLLPFIGILMSNIVVRAITEEGDFRSLLLVVGGLGCLEIAGCYLEQRSSGVINAQASMFSQTLDDLLTDKLMTCDYENLEDKKILGRFQEATMYIWANQRYLAICCQNLMLLISGVFGFFVYLAVLRRFPLLLLLMAAATCLSFRFSDMGERERMKRERYVGEAVEKMAYLQTSSADPQTGKDIRMYQMYSWIEERFADRYREIRKDYISIEKKNFLSALITAALGIAMELAAYLVLTGMVMKAEITIAEYVLYIGAALGFSGWVRQIADQVRKLWMVNGDLRCYRECLDMEDRSAGRRSGREGLLASEVERRGLPCEIEFDRVCYRYPAGETDTIHDLSFHIKRGEKIALVGMNGAGKTTCVKLLCGLLEPTSGEIRINGIPIQDLEREEYFGLFSTVFQDIHLLPVSVRENITCCQKGREDRERLERCIRLADLSGRIAAMPRQEETLLVKEVEEEGINLSGGEQQRLLLARALYKDAPILVLDEPTAALDPISEDNVYRKYFELAADKTSIFISHRLASTQFCDRIFFLEGGRIAETGSHQELLALGGRYAEAFAVQSRYYKENPEESGEKFEEFLLRGEAAL